MINMKILLIETEYTGHHIALYLNSLVDNLLSKNHEITILTNKKAKHYPAFSYIRKKNIKILYLDDYKLFNRPNYFSILLNQIILFYKIKNKFYNNKEFDHIYFNTFSVIDKAISLLGSPFKKSLKFSGLMPSISIHKKFNFTEFLFYKNYINKFLFRKFLKIDNLKKVFIPDIQFFRYAKKNIDFNQKIHLSYDFGFFDEKINAQKTYLKSFKYFKNKLDKNKIYILVYGSIRYEKGLQYLLKALSLLDKKNRINLIIAGKQDILTENNINYYKNLSKLKDKLKIYNFFISKKLENYFFKKCDYVWTGYTKNYHGSSAVFFLSSQFFKPVITSNHGLINYYNKKFKIGYSVEIDNIKKIKKLLESIHNRPNRFKIKNFTIINKNHNQKKFSDNICSKIFS